MHYACSDIHGQYDTFLRMLQLIEFTEEDEMYILGDVIDRGPKPIELLLYICEHQNIKYIKYPLLLHKRYILLFHVPCFFSFLSAFINCKINS